MTPAEFEEACEKGAHYAIVDEVIVDMAPFYKWHPGGVFTLKHNIGQDISKFFHGSYSMEGNLEVKKVDKRVKHSNYARKIVNQLIVAQLDTPGYPVESTICMIDWNKTRNINESTKAFYFKATGPQTSFRSFYPGLSCLGKHFTIKNMSGSVKITRQYTTCNVMDP
jgi:hypothetical protein